MKKLLTLFLVLFSTFAYAGDIEGERAVLRGVDKVTGHTATSEIVVGRPTQFNNMRITVERCLKKPPEETPENAAFIIVEEEKDKAYQVVFKGWMFSSNPALSAMEHPIFDIWLLSCETPKPEITSVMEKSDESENTVSIESLPKELEPVEPNNTLEPSTTIEEQTELPEEIED